MYKYIILPLMLIFSGCSYFTFNAAMCESIASDPHATIPTECRNYNEAEAEKAFHNSKNKKQSVDEEIIKFQKEQE